MTNEQTALLLDSIIGELYRSIRDVEESLPDECFEDEPLPDECFGDEPLPDECFGDEPQLIGGPVRFCRHTSPLHDVRERLELRRDSLINKP